MILTLDNARYNARCIAATTIRGYPQPRSRHPPSAPPTAGEGALGPPRLSDDRLRPDEEGIDRGRGATDADFGVAMARRYSACASPCGPGRAAIGTSRACRAECAHGPEAKLGGKAGGAALAVRTATIRRRNTLKPILRSPPRAPSESHPEAGEPADHSFFEATREARGQPCTTRGTLSAVPSF
jgi:hypothetical protein